MQVDSSVLEVANGYLHGIKRSGPENIMAICPFHTRQDGTPERNPSFALSLTTGLWICHTCKERGTFRSLLRALEVPGNVIQTRYEVLFEELSRNLERKPRPDKVILDPNPPLDESCLGLFDYVSEQMLEWGFTEETLRDFNVGFDIKNFRITFPLRDFAGRLMGISGRTVIDAMPRYKIYDEKDFAPWGVQSRKVERSSLIWNMERVYPENYFKNRPDIVVVEGFKACMWVYQAGIRNVVALVGSYMSEQQCMILERIGGPYYFFLDNDLAGLKGKSYGMRRLSRSCEVYVVPYEEKQPTDLTSNGVLQALDEAQDYFTWSTRRSTNERIWQERR